MVLTNILFLQSYEMYNQKYFDSTFIKRLKKRLKNINK